MNGPIRQSAYVRALIRGVGNLPPFCLVVCCAIHLVGPVALGTEQGVGPQAAIGSAECGVYAILAAANAVGEDVNEIMVLSGDYVSSRAGSSGRDLINAAHDIGLEAQGVRSITVAYLRSSSFPVLLNLRPVGQDLSCTGHWVTYLGEKDGKALVFDVSTPGRLRGIKYGELASQMTGNGIVVFRRKEGGSNALMLSSWFAAWRPFGEGLAILAALGLLTRIRCESRWYSQLALLFLSVAAWVALNSIADPASPAQNRNVTAWIQSLHITTTFRDVSFQQIEAFRKRTDTAIVDARSQAAYKDGHIPGAISLSVHMGIDDFSKRIEQLRNRRCVVVYCNSRECHWAETVAQRLAAFGFPDVRVYRAGLIDYVDNAEFSQR